MLIVDGPNVQLADKVYELLKEQLDDIATFHCDGLVKMPSMRSIVKILNRDHRSEVWRGFLDYKTFTRGERHMIACGLAAAGTTVVVCYNVTSPDPAVNDYVCYDELIPEHLVLGGRLNVSVINSIIAQWTARRKSALDTWDYCSTGNSWANPIMLVGDHPMPKKEIDNRRLAFVTHNGSSTFLHDVLHKAGGRYYLTNAVKYEVDILDRACLQEEISKVNPSRIISMGDAAAKLLSDIGATFHRTYHPQHWARFKRSHEHALINFLKP